MLIISADIFIYIAYNSVNTTVGSKFTDTPQTKQQTEMDKFYSLTKTNQKLVIATIAILLYGYLCRLFNLYFLWESKAIGWTLLFITLIFLLRQRINWKKTINRKTISEKIGIGVLVFILLIQTALFFVMPQTNAYKSAKFFIKSDKTISNEVGEVTGITLMPYGGMSVSSNSQGEQGQADFNFIVKGTKKYKDYNLQVAKDFDTEWRVIKPE